MVQKCCLSKAFAKPRSSKRIWRHSKVRANKSCTETIGAAEGLRNGQRAGNGRSAARFLPGDLCNKGENRKGGAPPAARLPDAYSRQARSTQGARLDAPHAPAQEPAATAHGFGSP